MDGADEAAFLEADARMQGEFVYQQPGIVRRMTARGTRGEWLVLTFWGSEDHAESAATASEDDPAARAFTAFVDPSTLGVRRYTTLD